MTSLSTKQQISKGKITVDKHKPRGKIDGTKYSKIRIDGKRLLIKTEGKSWGLRYEEDRNGRPKYTMPMLVSDEFQSTLYEIADKLGDEDYAPIYETDDGPLVYIRLQTNGCRKSLLQNEEKEKVEPSDFTSTYTGVTAVVEVDSLRESREYDTKMQLTLYQAVLEELEPEEVEDLLTTTVL